jgi:hypothetical protein
MTTEMERVARESWAVWGWAFLLYTGCASCGQQRVCRGRRRSRMLCLDCWDGGAR